MGGSTSDFIKRLYFGGETFSLEPAEQTFTVVKQNQKNCISCGGRSHNRRSWKHKFDGILLPEIYRLLDGLQAKMQFYLHCLKSYIQ